MSSSIRVEGVEFSSINWRSFDHLVVTCAYEERANYIFDSHINQFPDIICFGFPDKHVLSYDENRRRFAARDITVCHVDDLQFEQQFFEIVGRLIAKQNAANLFVDISSLNRYRIASVVKALAIEPRLRITFSYVIAEPESSPRRVPVTRQGLVHPFFSGWSAYPQRPLFAIASVGYEEEKLIALLDTLEADQAIILRTDHHDPQYYDSVTKANTILWERLNPESVVSFDILRPVDLFLLVDNLLFSLSSKYRIVVLPLEACWHAASTRVPRLSGIVRAVVWKCQSIGKRRAKLFA